MTILKHSELRGTRVVRALLVILVWTFLVLFLTSCRPYFNQANTIKPDRHAKPITR